MTINERVSDEPMTHDLKIYPEFFSAVATGVKRAELRKNDRAYRVGDKLHLMETPRGSCHSTGEYINATITHIADVNEWIPGYVLLSIERELQQYRAAAEPMYQAKFSLGWRDVTKEQYDDNAAHGAPVRIVYAAPQVTSDALIQFAEFMAAEAIKSGDYPDGWQCKASNAAHDYAQDFRATMLNGGKS